MNHRMCLAHTVLPRGGGPDGSSPLFIRAGVIIELHNHAMQRDKGFFGDDADDFNPYRWQTIRARWEYVPFSGGPRVCPAIHMTYAETAFVLVSILREVKRLDCRDEVWEWQEDLKLAAQSKRGAKVGLIWE